MSATYRIIQNAVAGEYGIARQDLTLFSVGGTITLEAQDQTGGSSDYVWEVLSEPAGSTATITTPTPAAPWIVEVDLTVTGGYLFRLIFKPGEVDEDISVLYLGIPLEGSGLCIPALNETIFDNSYSAGGSGDTYVGYERKTTAMLKWFDENGSGGSPGGVDTQLQYNNAGAFAGSELYYDAASDKLGLRNTSPLFDIDIVNDPAAGPPFGAANVAVRTYSSLYNSSLVLLRANGTPSVPTAVQAGDSVGSISWFGTYGAGALDAHNCANIHVEAAEDFIVGSGGADVVVYSNTPGGGVIPKRRATFQASGDFSVFDGGIRIQEYQGSEAAGVVEWNGTNFRGYTGTAWVNLDSAGGGSLDASYDIGAAITADAGAVTIANAVADATNALELTRSTAGSGSALSITQQVSTGSALKIVNDLDAFQAEAGSSIFLTSSGTGRQNIWSDQELYIGSSVPALGVYLKNVAAGTSLLRMQSEATGANGDGTTWVTASGAGDGIGYLLLQASGAGTGAETKIDIKAQAGSTGPGHVDITASGGSAYVLAGAGTCAVRLNDENRAASTWGQAYIPLSDVSTEWDALEANCSGEVSLIQAINLAFAGAGGTPVTLAASATTGGLDLTVQEIGFQAASAGTPVSAAVTSLGDVDTEVRRLNTTTWAEDTWWTSGEYPKEIFRHDGGTTWTSFVNASDAGSAGYNWHVWHNGELWVGGNDATHKIWSFNPGTEVWTGRGGVGDVIAYTGIGVWDSTIVVGNLFDRVYKYVSGTTWTDLGKPGADRIRDLVDIGGVLFARNEFGVVYEYSGAGTSWASVSVPMVAEKITNWNGVLVAACKDAGKPVVYKYEASTWTKLGGDLNAGSTFFDFIAADSSGSLYAQPSGGTTVDIYKYDAGLDSWSSVGSYASASGKETYDGEFNPSDVAAFGVAEDEIRTFQDDHLDPVNGYLTSTDWTTFNNKGAPTTLAASAITGGLSITDQEISNQAATATAATAATVSLGDPSISTSQSFRVIDANGTVVATGENSDNILLIHTSGTTWEEKVSGGDGTIGFKGLVYHDGEVWCGSTGTHQVYSYNIGTDTWTGRGAPNDFGHIETLAVHDGGLYAAGGNGHTYLYVSGTTWTDLGAVKSQDQKVEHLCSSGGVLYAVVYYNFVRYVYKYVSGTTWTDESFSRTNATMRLADFNGTLVVASQDSDYPVVYEYTSGTTWTQLGDDLTAGYNDEIRVLAADSSNQLYAVIAKGIYKYSGAAWSLAQTITSTTPSFWYGEFSSEDVLLMSGLDEVVSWQDAHFDLTNGYLSGADWNTFNRKAALPSTALDEELVTWDTDGVPSAVDAGTATYVLTSNGAGVAPTFQAAAVGGDVSAAAVIADHSVVRGDGGAKGVQGSTLLISDTGQLSTGNEAAPDCSAGGITLQQGTDAALILSLKGSNVVHPFTTQAEADTFGGLRRWSATDGGINCQGFGANAVSGIILNSYTETPATANTGDGIGVLHVLTRKSNGGTSNQALASTDNAVSLATDASSGVKTILKGSGDIYQVAGGHRLSSWVNTPVAGAIEWDGTNFRGYNGTSWVNLDN